MHKVDSMTRDNKESMTWSRPVSEPPAKIGRDAGLHSSCGLRHCLVIRHAGSIIRWRCKAQPGTDT